MVSNPWIRVRIRLIKFTHDPFFAWDSSRGSSARSPCSASRHAGPLFRARRLRHLRAIRMAHRCSLHRAVFIHVVRLHLTWSSSAPSVVRAIRLRRAVFTHGFFCRDFTRGMWDIFTCRLPHGPRGHPYPLVIHMLLRLCPPLLPILTSSVLVVILHFLASSNVSN
jgi:hypothetical protein